MTHPRARRDGEDVTRRTLLLRVKDSTDEVAWAEFFALYSPLIEAYAKARGLDSTESEELRGDVMVVVVKKLPGFDYDPQRGRFKGWLRKLTHDRVVDHLRKRGAVQADPAVFESLIDPAPGPDELWDRSWREEHLRFALARAGRRVSEQSYQAFCLLLDSEQTVEQVAETMKMTMNQVYKAKSRTLKAVREVLASLEANELLD